MFMSSHVKCSCTGFLFFLKLVRSLFPLPAPSLPPGTTLFFLILFDSGACLKQFVIRTFIVVKILVSYQPRGLF